MIDAAMKENARQGDGSFARDHVRTVAQRVEVVSKTEVRIAVCTANYSER